MANYNPGKTLSLRWLLWQLLVVAGLATTYGLFLGLQASYSAFLGGIISVVASGYFAWKLFTHTGARAAQRIVANLYVAEALKLTLSAIGLALVFIWAPVNAAAVLIGFIVTYLCSLIILGLLALR